MKKVKVLDNIGDINLIEYNNDRGQFWGIELNNNSIGRTLFFTDNKDEALKEYSKTITQTEKTKRKKQKFIDKIETLSLNNDVIEEIKQLADSMEAANLIGETELAKTYKSSIKRVIKENYKEA